MNPTPPESNLLACPFCGGTHLEPASHYGYGIQVSVKCHSCGSKGPFKFKDWEADEAWNKRTLGPIEETLIYDALTSIQENSTDILTLVRLAGSEKANKAFRDGIYAPCVKLQVLLGTAALERGKARHEKIKQECAVYFAAKNATEQPTETKP